MSLARRARLGWHSLLQLSGRERLCPASVVPKGTTRSTPLVGVIGMQLPTTSSARSDAPSDGSTLRRLAAAAAAAAAAVAVADAVSVAAGGAASASAAAAAVAAVTAAVVVAVAVADAVVVVDDVAVAAAAVAAGGGVAVGGAAVGSVDASVAVTVGAAVRALPPRDP